MGIFSSYFDIALVVMNTNMELKSNYNRNLKTMEISLDVGEAMLPHIPADRIAVAESGLFLPADLARMASSGARCFLIGESLMRADDVAAATATILANAVGATA